VFKKRKKISPEASDINFKNVSLLNQFTDSSNKILGRKQSGLDAKKQRMMQKAIKQARTLGLIK
jgi:small subunit ribosomal protein S18